MPHFYGSVCICSRGEIKVDKYDCMLQKANITTLYWRHFESIGHSNINKIHLYVTRPCN